MLRKLRFRQKTCTPKSGAVLWRCSIHYFIGYKICRRCSVVSKVVVLDIKDNLCPEAATRVVFYKKLFLKSDSHLQKNCFICFNEPFQNDEKCSFRWENSLIRKKKLISKFRRHNLVSKQLKYTYCPYLTK